MKPQLLNKNELELSAIVANNRMNRKRNAIGVNSYEKDIYFNPIDFLKKQKSDEPLRWLDLCCGEGKALIQAAEGFYKEGLASDYALEGLDLVDFFNDFDSNLNLSLNAQNLESWIPNKEYDLITVVHGLHYVGDKIDVIRKCLSALKQDGFFIANLDVSNILMEDQKNSRKRILDLFKRHTIDYQSRRRLLTTAGKRVLESSFQYLGADDTAGPNYTGQEVVNSYYRVSTGL